MKKFFSDLKNKVTGKKTLKEADDVEYVNDEEDFVELDTNNGSQNSQKVIVRPFSLEDFQDIKPILDIIREGNTVCLINIRPLKDKDMIELKRAINKLKKTTDAVGGEIAGLSEDYIVVAPDFATIYRSKPARSPEEL